MPESMSILSLLFEFSRQKVRRFTEKVSFNIASYTYILSGQKLIKTAKKWSIWNPEVCGQIVLPYRPKISGKCQRHFEWFSNTVRFEDSFFSWFPNCMGNSDFFVVVACKMFKSNDASPKSS